MRHQPTAGYKNKMAPFYRPLWALLFAGSMTLAACGGTIVADTGDETEALQEESTTDTQEKEAQDNTDGPEGTSAPASPTDDSNDDSGGIEYSVFRAVPSGPAEFPILDGTELEFPGEAFVETGGQCLYIYSHDEYTGDSPFPPAAGISHAKFIGTDELLEPIDSIAEWLALYTDAGEPAPKPTGTTIELLGETLTTFELTGSFPEMPPTTSFINCSTDPGVVSESSYIHASYGTVHATEFDGGLLFISASGYTEEEAVEAQNILDGILPTLKLSE